ncbi:MAG: LL-diaminopimelate aminotransferase [Chloroflexota bacterium]|nr:LL-diaminopimelate aminotransferase [Dehalococcoidia bacterium]MDW8253893.1 LL-diaminopimelate aminotransferase [Chloroflexota bacterium]
MRFAQRIEKLPPYLFVEVTRKINRMRAEGRDVISLGIGDPDIPTPDYIIDRLVEAARVPANHRYPESDGLPQLREAIAGWYERRFGVRLDPNKEVLPLIGSKEGIGHIALCFIDPGDLALVTDPGYPVYSVGTMFAGGETYWLPLTEERGWKPDLDAIPEEVARKAKVLWINYPNNPTGAVAELDFFERCVHFAKKYDVAVLHDAPYTEVAYDGYRPHSFLEVPGARDVGVEFHSLSKTYNMTGWRVGMAVGNARIIDALLRVKSNLDSGIPQAIQEMAIAALNGPMDAVFRNNAILQYRRDLVCEVLNKIGLRAPKPKASLYVWAALPAGVKSIDFSARLVEETAVFVTPGIGYGPSGEGYVRISLTAPTERIEEAMRRLAAWKPEEALAAS